MTVPRRAPTTHRAPENWRSIVRRGGALAKAKDPEGLRILLGALRWRYDTARNEAVRTIASLRPPPVPHLLHIARSAETAVERRGAIDSLGRIGGPKPFPVLLGALRDPNMVVRRAATVALLRGRATSAVPRISALLRDDSGGVRVLAATVLGRLQDRRAVPALLRALNDPKWYVRQAAAEALGAIGDRKALDALSRTAGDPRPAVARAAREAIVRVRRTPTAT